MQGRPGRLASIKASWASFLSEASDASKTVGSVIKGVWQSESLRATAQTFSLQAWTGISFSSFFSSIPIATQYAEARAPLLGQAPNGVATFGGFIPDNTVKLLIEVAIAGGISYQLHAMPGMHYGAYMFDMAAWLYLSRGKLNRSINNIFSQAAVIKAATPNPVHLQKAMHKHLLFKPCGNECGETGSIMADVMAVPESIIDTAFSYSVANACSLLSFSLQNPMPYINSLVLYPLLSLKYGRDILNVKLSSVGMCETHRKEIITANNAYCLAKGATLLFGVYALPKGVGWLLDSYGYSWASALINDEFVSSGFFAYSYLSFAQAELQITNTLPGTKPGIDIFKNVHVAAQEVTKWTVSRIVELSWNPTSTVTWDDQLKKINEVYRSAPIKLAMTVCIGRDAMSLRAFLQRPAAHSFVKVYESSLRENIEWLQSLRFHGIARTILKVLPERILNPATKNFLIAWGSKNMDGPAKSLNVMLDKIYPNQFPYIPPKSEMTSIERVKSIAQMRVDSGPADLVERRYPRVVMSDSPILTQRNKSNDEKSKSFGISEDVRDLMKGKK